jgi:phosphomannomutase/phosphoglucomutase
MLFAKDVLSRNPGAEIIYDVKCTALLGPWIERHGGKPVIWKTGHSFLKAKLKESGAPLAGEMSGHIFFKSAGTGSTMRSTPARGCSRSSRTKPTPATR